MIKPASETTAGDWGEAYPASRKVYVDGAAGVRVPMREISLSGGEPPLRVYDPSGPLGCDVREGLPKLREEWVLGRGDVERFPHSHTPTLSHSQATATVAS